MGEPTPKKTAAKSAATPANPDAAAIEISKAQAAKAVCRLRPVPGKDGQPTGKFEELPVDEDDVLDYVVRGDEVVVVTTDGQKLVGKL